MLPFLIDDLELENDFVNSPLDLRFVPVERLSDGQRVKVLEPKLVDSTELSKFDSRDFQLQEILESGSYDLLQPCAPIKLNCLSSLDCVEKSSAELEAYMEKYSSSVDSVVKTD